MSRSLFKWRNLQIKIGH